MGRDKVREELLVPGFLSVLVFVDAVEVVQVVEFEVDDIEEPESVHLEFWFERAVRGKLVWFDLL